MSKALQNHVPVFKLILLALIGVTSSTKGLTQTPYFSIFGGWNWESSGTTTLVNFVGVNTSQYVPNNNYTIGPIVGIDIGWRQNFPRSGFWYGLGLESSYTKVTSSYGTKHPFYFSTPPSDTLNYNYSIASVPLFIMGQIAREYRNFQGYLIGGIGVSWNSASNYNEIPTDPSSSATANKTMFQDHTRSDFAYTVGAGIGTYLGLSSALSLEYRYTDYGHARFNGALVVGDGVSQNLSLGDISSNALLLKITSMHDF